MLLVSFLEKRKFQHHGTKKIIAVSQTLKNDLIEEYGILPDKIDVIYNGADPDRFKNGENRDLRNTMLKKLGIPPDSTVILFVGGDWERKGLSYLLEAHNQLNRSDVHVLVIGHGNPDLYSSQISDTSETVHFHFFDEQIENWYNISDIFVLPSIYEPFGMVVVEAMASGLPVITAAIAGVSEIIENGYDGIIIDNPADVNKLKKHLVSLINNPSLRKQMGSHARIKAFRCSWSRIAAETRLIYKKLRQEESSIGPKHKLFPNPETAFQDIY